MEISHSGNLRDRELSDRVIGAAIEVHRSLGPGFLESFYEEALCIARSLRGTGCEHHYPVTVLYRDQEIGSHRLDLLIEGRLVVELKTVQEIDPIHFSVVRSYVKACNASSAIIMNFHSMPLTINRVGTEPFISSPLSFS